MVRAAGSPTPSLAGPVHVSVGGLNLEIRLNDALGGIRQTLVRIVEPFMVAEEDQNGVVVEVRCGNIPPEPLAPRLKEAIRAPLDRFPRLREPDHHLALAHPYSGELNAHLAEEFAQPVIYPFLDGLVFGTADRERFTVLLKEGTGTRIAAWAVLHSLYFLISLLMVQRGGLMLHASAIRLKGRAVVFLGASGSGKTTLMKLAGKKRGLADDCVLVKASPRGFLVADTPFNQLLDLDSVSSSPSCGLGLALFLARAKNHRLEPLGPGSAAARILANHVHFLRYFPGDAALRAFRLTARLAREIPFGVLNFAKDQGFIPLLKGELEKALG